ncbi:MAG: hypothetical protein K1X88_31160 [Nannocystaceae bacterium]|nr:hypothetical protein [Nannocystaceae bacterium]
MSPRRALALVAFSACTAGAQGVPEGKLAAVGEVAFGPEDVAGVQAQLGAYAQLRFGGEGAAALLMALVDAEVLAQEALAQGLGDDPRVWYAVLEELAALHLAAELERRVPRAAVAADRAALQAAYDADTTAFVLPQRRAAAGVVFEHWREAEDALAAVQSGAVALESLGALVTTPLQARDDGEFPGFHPTLFDPSLQVGELLPRPVVLGERLLVGRLEQDEPATRRAFDDPAVQEQLVERVRAPRVQAATAALLESLPRP